MPESVAQAVDGGADRRMIGRIERPVAGRHQQRTGHLQNASCEFWRELGRLGHRFSQYTARRMRAVDIILKKRDGGTLSRDEVRFFVAGVTDGTLPD